jgi:hypothetical protein
MGYAAVIASAINTSHLFEIEQELCSTLALAKCPTANILHHFTEAGGRRLRLPPFRFDPLDHLRKRVPWAFRF